MKEIDIQCDLIIHNRGENELQNNLIALEMKRVFIKVRRVRIIIEYYANGRMFEETLKKNIYNTGKKE